MTAVSSADSLDELGGRPVPGTQPTAKAGAAVQGGSGGTRTGTPPGTSPGADRGVDRDVDRDDLWDIWGDGVIARRAPQERGGRSGPLPEFPVTDPAPPVAPRPAAQVGGALRERLEALRELVGLSGARLDRRALAEAGRVLEEAAARQRLSLDLTVVAIAGATGSGKSTLFNALARARLSESGVRRPTTAEPVACAWTETDRAGGLLDRLGIRPGARREPARPYDPGLSGLVLLDLPDHDSAAAGHREQVDRLLRLVDAVIWVVDPEKYADAVLHERYLRPLAGYAEVTFVVLNQVDRLSRDAADQVLDDLRRLLDDDGLALGEHGEPGATVLALSALTGEGVGELRDVLGQFAARRSAAELRLTADVDGVSARLRPVYVADGHPGLTERARQDFEDRLAEAVGAAAAGLGAERAWLREAERVCGPVWLRVWRWHVRLRRGRPSVGVEAKGSTDGSTLVDADGPGGARGAKPLEDARQRDAGEHGERGEHGEADEPLFPVPRRTASRPLVEQAVRALAHEASAGLPGPWAQAVREAAGRGAEGLAEALDEAAARADAGRVGERPSGAGRTGGRRTGVWLTGAWRTDGGSAPEWRTAGRGAGEPAGPGGAGVVAEGATLATDAGEAGGSRRPRLAARALRAVWPRWWAGRPRWWAVVATGQMLLAALQLLGLVWLVGMPDGDYEGPWWLAVVLLVGCGAVGPALAWCCGLAARGPARRFGAETERRLRGAAAGCGRARVLEPVAAELLRYREVRAQYVIAAGEVTGLSTTGR
ncbi:GTPase [Streptomyces sp. NPDC049577]|uniref:GTPase n=1 Tax=Streptomyces sp. NPDC049577 TaxID=3155153 RepID=UPI0034333749